jgi:hypothetical protein
METGQETPTTMLRVIRDVNHPALGVGLDTANLILYGKANPVDAVKIIGPYVRATHAKDGKWPTNPSELGEEVVIGKGDVDFAKVIAGLHAAGYTGALTIGRGPQPADRRRSSGSLPRAHPRSDQIRIRRLRRLFLKWTDANSFKAQLLPPDSSSLSPRLHSATPPTPECATACSDAAAAVPRSQHRSQKTPALRSPRSPTSFPTNLPRANNTSMR